jgi:alanyl-tRNA synthetase
MDAVELRNRYLKFFEARAHRVIPAAPLLPENDPTVLFTTAGMHPLVPFLLGEPHPLGRRLVNFQKCIRTNDIDEVGDPSHLTFFEMLGNWSLGDYFKKESLTWSHEFLVRELGIDLKRLAVTVFAGDADAPRDDVSASIWHRLGIPGSRIYYLPKADNWWGPAGLTGPCGPDSEIFFDTGRPDHAGCRPGCACGKWFEIWNNVFMEYNKTLDGKYLRLQQRNVDTGMGVERTIAVLNGFDDIFQVETVAPLVLAVETLTDHTYLEHPASFRIIADHLRAAVFAIADGALPSNVEAGYVVRRMVRRAVRQGRELGIKNNFCGWLSQSVIETMGDIYPKLVSRAESISQALDEEETKFKRTLDRGLRQYHKLENRLQMHNQTVISGEQAFDLFETHGFPLELTEELAHEHGLTVDRAGFHTARQMHQELSRQTSAGAYRGGLADHAAQTTRLHTATHLLHQALRTVLGEHVSQRGSNITVERLRFDFSHPEKLSLQEISAVEALVNAQIEARLPVNLEVTTLEQALERGALAFFGEKYGEQVKVYSIGNFSKEVCGGPHVANTGELGHLRILKEESVGRGIRRIRAVLETPEH